jgi:hypothetical protein
MFTSSLAGTNSKILDKQSKLINLKIYLKYLFISQREIFGFFFKPLELAFLKKHC